MVQFRITPHNGKPIGHGLYVVFWKVEFFVKTLNQWVFLKAFYTEERAVDFVQKVRLQIRKGDFSCLTLRT